jgi:hypothetical protein
MLKDSQLHFKALPSNRNHIDHIESAGLQGSLEVETAGSRAVSASSGIAHADGGGALPIGNLSRYDLSRQPQYLWKAYSAKSIEKRFHALAQVKEVDRSRKNDEIGCVHFFDYRGKIILNDAALLGQAQPPSIFIALPAPFKVVLGQE